MASHYPKLLALELELVKLVRCVVGRDVLAEVVENLQTWRPLEDEL